MSVVARVASFVSGFVLPHFLAVVAAAVLFVGLELMIEALFVSEESVVFSVLVAGVLALAWISAIVWLIVKRQQPLLATFLSLATCISCVALTEGNIPAVFGFIGSVLALSLIAYAICSFGAQLKASQKRGLGRLVRVGGFVFFLVLGDFAFASFADEDPILMIASEFVLGG